MSLVSIIVPVYNTERYVKTCIESIINQTYKEIEIIIIDDGSTDSSATICDSYAAKYEAIKVIHQENSGVAVARKVGVECATGKYVMFVDSDDWIEKDMIRKMYLTAEQRYADIVCCEYFIDGVDYSLPSKCKVPNYTEYVNKQEVFKDLNLYNAIYVWLWNKLFSKKLFNSNIDYFEGVKMGEDYGVLIQLINNAD